MHLKAKVRAWKQHDGMRTKDIKEKLLEEDKLDIAMSTLSTWQCPSTMEKVVNIAPDRIYVNDVRYNPKQRPDVIVDMENILARKVMSITVNGLPYSREILQILAIHIFHKLIGYNLYNEQGQRKHPDQPIDEDIIQAVEHAQLTTQYLAKSTKKTEWHKSQKARRNGPSVPNQCKLCPRHFKCNVNLTLHVYWHTMNDQKRAQEMNDDPDDPMAVDNSNSEDEDGDTSESELNFLFSPGWIQKFMSLHNDVCVDSEPIEPWINEWLTFLHTECYKTP